MDKEGAHLEEVSQEQARESLDPTMKPDELLERDDLRKLIEKRISRLTGKNVQEVARRIFIEGDSDQEVADALGLTHTRVWDIKQEIIRVIKTHPGELGPYGPERKDN
jgi:DNA-directed RNA polymerase sigma subunit (sigma70/sigma32)